MNWFFIGAAANRKRKEDKLELMARAMMTDEQYQKFKELEKQQQSGDERRALLAHVATFIIANAMMIMIWQFTDNGGYFWPLWVMGPWGIALVAHFAAYSFTKR